MSNIKGQIISPGWILILIFIFIMATTVGLIIYNQTSYYNIKINTTPNSSTYYKPPTIYNSSTTVWNNTNNTNSSINKHCCYPKECEELYNNTNCDKSCIYLVKCFRLNPNETLEQHLNNQIN